MLNINIDIDIYSKMGKIITWVRFTIEFNERKLRLLSITTIPSKVLIYLFNKHIRIKRKGLLQGKRL